MSIFFAIENFIIILGIENVVKCKIQEMLRKYYFVELYKVKILRNLYFLPNVEYIKSFITLYTATTCKSMSSK